MISEGAFGGAGFITLEHPTNSAISTSNRHTDHTFTDFPLGFFSDELRPWVGGERNAILGWSDLQTLSTGGMRFRK
jgi:hypothetical protein